MKIEFTEYHIPLADMYSSILYSTMISFIKRPKVLCDTLRENLHYTIQVHNYTLSGSRPDLSQDVQHKRIYKHKGLRIIYKGVYVIIVPNYVRIRVKRPYHIKRLYDLIATLSKINIVCTQAV